MNRRASTMALAVGVGLAGMGAGAVLGSGVAGAATGTTNAVKDRASAIRDALAGLVKDGTITDKQADTVASTLSQAPVPGRGFGGPGGPGRGGDGPGGFGRVGVGPLESAAGVLGLSVQDLRTQLDSGKSLTQIAAGKGMSKADLVTKLVAARKTEIAAAVTAGRLTQTQADGLVSSLQTRISAEVDRVGLPHGGHRGDGPGHWAPGSAPGSTPGSTPTPVPTPSGQTS